MQIEYTNNEGQTDVTVTDERNDRGSYERRQYERDFGNGPSAPNDGLVFTHRVQSGDIKLDDILPPWGDSPSPYTLRKTE